MKRPLIVLTGPTAVGKTKPVYLTCKSSERGNYFCGFHAGIYKHMDIGSAKITQGRNAGRGASSGGCTWNRKRNFML